MASQADKDTARAKSRQGGGQTARDTERAQSRTQADTERAKSRQNGEDGGTGERMSQREAAAGLNLAGNDTMSGRGQPMPTMLEREEAAGLNLAGNDTLSGRGDSFYDFKSDTPSGETVDHGVHDNTNDVLPAPNSFFDAIVCRNGKPFSASIQGTIGNEIT
jgi:hypothetical protein